MKVIVLASAKSAIGWLRPSETLTVLAISNAPTAGTQYLIWSDQQHTAALFPASDFKIVDARLSRRWVASFDASGFVFLAPGEWQSNGFWERFHDGEESAERIFKEEMATILGE